MRRPHLPRITNLNRSKFYLRTPRSGVYSRSILGRRRSFRVRCCRKSLLPVGGQQFPAPLVRPARRNVRDARKGSGSPPKNRHLSATFEGRSAVAGRADRPIAGIG